MEPECIHDAIAGDLRKVGPEEFVKAVTEDGISPSNLIKKLEARGF